MNLAASEKIQWLEQRHTELIEGLDALNSRLEQTLNSLLKSPEQQEPEQQESKVSQSARVLHKA